MTENEIQNDWVSMALKNNVIQIIFSLNPFPLGQNEVKYM